MTTHKHLIIQNALSGETGEPLHLEIVEGVIQSASEKKLSVPTGAHVIDASGLLVLPGLFDAHVHFREPGQEAKEDIESGVQAAINGGVTGVVMMPNTSPPLDRAAVVRSVLDRAAQVSPIPVYTSGCITSDRAGAELAGIEGMRREGVTMLTDDGDPVANPAVLMRAMEYASEFGMFFASHCETPELAGPRALNDGAMAYQLGIKGSPACSEEICLARDIALAHAVGARIHIQHVSTRLGMEMILWWKDQGAEVTAEVTPHHLIFDDQDIGDYNTSMKMNPPLRTREDREALLQGLNEGVIDMIATDHAPHTEFEKSLDFASAPNGITGLETALNSLHHHFICSGKLSWATLIERYSRMPRRLMGLEPAELAPGRPADLLLYNPAKDTLCDAGFFRSRAINTPFLNQSLRGSIEYVILGSEVLLDRTASV